MGASTHGGLQVWKDWRSPTARHDGHESRGITAEHALSIRERTLGAEAVAGNRFRLVRSSWCDKRLNALSPARCDGWRVLTSTGRITGSGITMRGSGG